LIEATDGNFYGTSHVELDDPPHGTLFRMTRTGEVTVLRTGIVPTTPLIQATDGYLYGTAYYDGPCGGTAIFRMALDGSGFSLLHPFLCGDPLGTFPAIALLQAADGTFYATARPAPFSAGPSAVLKMTPDGELTVLHVFTTEEGSYPSALIQGADGDLYGTLLGEYPGTGRGAVFKITPGGSLTIVHQFTGANGDGSDPRNADRLSGGSPLVRASDGILYGTTDNGGPFDLGTVFRVTPDGVASTVYAFRGTSDDAHPLGGLALGTDGSLYGTTAAHSAVFRVTTAGVLTPVATLFPGATPEAALIEGTDGSLYGTTADDGPNYTGTVFRIAPDGVTTTLHAFTRADGALPSAALLQGAADGNFYGTTAAGGSSDLGTIFRMAPDGSVTVLHAFAGGDDGSRSFANLVRGPDGAFYGTTRDGGPLNFGTVFRVTADGAYKVLYRFAGGLDGGHPLAGLVLSTDGNFYGTTSITGAFNAGTTFRITPQGSLTILHWFSGTLGTGRDGSYPRAALMQARDGNFYGTTYAGGTFGYGTLFRMTAEGTVTVLHSFSLAVDGANPVAPLIQARDGNFYGTTSEGGGCCFYGTAFRLTLPGNTSTVHSFYQYEGTAPHAALLQARDGNLYGTAAKGPFPSGGSVFRIRLLPDAPIGLTVTVAGNGSVFLAWGASPQASSYIVKRLADGAETVLVQGITATTFTDTTPKPNGLYGYVVLAVNANGVGAPSNIALGPVSPPGQSRTPTILTVRDYDGDGRADVAVYRQTTGEWFIRQSKDGRLMYQPWGAPSLGDVPVPADLNGDGKADIAVYRRSTGQWFGALSLAGPYLQVAWGAALGDDLPVPGDYDGDGKADLAVYRPSTGQWFILLSSTGSLLQQSWGAAQIDIPVPADYDGDHKIDIAVYRTTTGEWFIRRSSDGGLTYQPWGAPSLGDVPVPADYDGDGKADVAVYRRTTGQWFGLLSSNGAPVQVSWGAASGEDLPVPGDYDGDGKADLAVYRPSTGQWFILLSSTRSLVQQSWGAAQIDIPVPGDYDGDHKVDLAVYRTTTGEWFIRRSSDGGLTYQPWGAPSLGDMPIPADYDGDGKADITVFRQSSGDWFVRRSSNGSLQQVAWGAPSLGDTPVSGDFDLDGKADIAVYRASTGGWFIRRSSDGGLTNISWGSPPLLDVVR